MQLIALVIKVMRIRQKDVQAALAPNAKQQKYFFLQPEAPKYLKVSIYDVEDDDGDCYRSLRCFFYYICLLLQQTVGCQHLMIRLSVLPQSISGPGM